LSQTTAKAGIVVKSRWFGFFAVLFLLAGLAGGQLWPRGVGEGAAFNRNRNGIWLDVVWTSQSHSTAEVASLAADLAGRGFRYAYVYVNSVQASGKPNPSTYAHAREFVSAAKAAAPELQLLAWIGVVNQARGQGSVDLENPTVRANLTNFCRELVTDQGFDGVQLDVEPLPNDSQDYLALLAETRTAVGPSKVLGIAGHKWAPAVVPSPENYSSYWLSDYYRAVGAHVDQVAVMTYDSYAPTPLAYRLFVREQTLGVLRALEGTETEVLIGLPSYHEPRPNHNPLAENVEVGLTGVLDALSRDWPPDGKPLAGVAIYAHWEMDEADWQKWDRLWLGRLRT
jgi:hypothetical protein